MTSRRGVVVVGTLVAIVIALVVWRARRDDAPATAAKPTEAAHVAATAVKHGRDAKDPAWLAQRGVADRRIAGLAITADGAPVRGAKVRLANALTRARELAEPTAVTDDTGHFDLGVQPAIEHLVAADAAGLTGALATVDLRDPTARPDELRLVLQPCIASIHGTVRDSAGGVVAHARVSRHVDGFAAGGAEAGDDGSYELCVEPGGEFVHVRADGYATLGEAVNVFGRTLRDFELVPGATIVGRVVRADDKQPVEGALVEAEVAGRGGWASGGHGVSDADGRFEIEDLAPGRYSVTASAGELTTAHPVDATAELGRSPEKIECPVVAASSVAGTVVDHAGGKPVGGVEVVLAMQNGPYRPQTAMAQADGSFVIERVLPGTYIIATMTSLRATDAPATVDVKDAAVTGVVVELGGTGSIAGRVLHGGKPVGNVRVFDRRNGATATTDAQGHYTLDHLVAGTYALYAESHREGAFVHDVEVTVADGEKKSVDIDLALSGSIEGVIVDQNDAPVAGAFVKFSLLGGEDYGAATTDDAGRFAARALSGGGDYVYEVRERDGAALVFAPVTEKRFPPVTVADGNTHVTGLRIKVRYERFTISGRVLDAQGMPAADVSVRASNQRRARVPTAFTDESGRFTLRDLPAGTYGVYAHAVRGDARESGIDAGRSDVVLRLGDFGGLEGKLVGFTAEVSVAAVGDKVGLRRAVVTDGEFRFIDLPAGSYTLQARSATQVGEARVTTTAGATANVTITAEHTGSIDVVIVDAKSRAPLELASCTAVRRGQTSSRLSTQSSQPTETDGTFHIANVLPGAYKLTCGGPRLNETTAEATVGGDQVTRVELAIEQHEAPALGTLGMELEVQLDDARVKSVTAGGPAARAGIVVGDVVVKLGDLSAKDDPVYRLVAQLDSVFAGKPITLVLERGDNTITVSIVPEPRE